MAAVTKNEKTSKIEIMLDWNWDVASNIADTVTALCAVAGIILAAALGLKAIRIAKGESDRGEQEFLYSQVDAILQGALALTSAAVDASRGGVENSEAERRLSRSIEAFESRMRVLQEVHLISEDSRASVAVNQFASVLGTVARCSQRLRSEGRALLEKTIFDGENDGSGILADLAQRTHGHSSYFDESIGYELSGSDGREVSPAFAPDAQTASELRKRLTDPGWEPHIDESLRLILPWVRSELGWLSPQAYDEDGAPIMMVESDWGAYFDCSRNEMITPGHPKPDVAAWLDEWPNMFWSLYYHPGGAEYGASPETPEELTLKLVNDIRTAFIDRVVALVSELRATTDAK